MHLSCLAPLTLALTACALPQQEAEALDSSAFDGLEMRSLGPALMSGRIADIAIHPEDESIWYVAVGSGGVWKTENAGTTWTPIFDEQVSYSIGCLAIDPSNPSTVWVGTGENVGGRHVGYGDGLYRSRDGGQTWEHRGLPASEHIGTISIDPRDSDTILVAAQGPLWTGGGERGVYLTTDGGDTWTQTLAGGEYTSANELVRSPHDPNVIFAARHQRFRNVAALINGGPESGIFKSIDGGATWREVSTGLPEEDMGKIGLACCPFDPDVVYATVELAGREGGFHRSDDGGESWVHTNDYLSGGTGPHYYQELWASPHAQGRVYQGDVWLHVTHDAGDTFAEVGANAKHSDNHAMAFNSDPNWILVGSDGGLYESFDLGRTYKFVANLPVTQFYKLALDDDEPFYNVYGGTQDNNSQAGPVRTDSANGIRNADWWITLGGDGHDTATEPGNPNIVYVEWQEGHLNRYDRITGETVDIQPQPRAGEESERYNWDAPILVSPHSPTRVYFASQRVWRSDDRGDSWNPVSGDLTSGLDRLELPMMGRVQSADAIWDLWAMSKYATITSLSESPVQEGKLYAGTDDGVIQSSPNGGQGWVGISSLPGVADGWFVNDVKADLFDPDVAYLCVDQHKNGDFSPYIFRTDDGGITWTSISGDLPDRHVVWRIVQDHVNPDLLFAGTEFGLFFTVDGGEHWLPLASGIPTIPVRDLEIQRRENDLVAATFGRGFYVLDDYAPLREATPEVMAKEGHLFAVRDPWLYVERHTLGGSGQAYQGDGYFVAENPPFGAVFTYHLSSGFERSEEARHAEEAEKIERGDDTPTPGWGVLERESREPEPEVVFTITDSTGAVVRRMSGPATAGLHRVAWDLRYPSVSPWSPSDDREPWESPDVGFLCMPGTYQAQLAIHQHGVLRPLGEPQSFTVKLLREGALPSASPQEMTTFHRQYEQVARGTGSLSNTLEEYLEAVEAIGDVLLRSSVDEAILSRTATLRTDLLDADLRLNGSQRRDFAGDPGPVSLEARFFLLDGMRFSTYGPTLQQREVLSLAAADLESLQETVRQLGAELKSLGEALDAAGVPWTPGRGF